MCDVVYMTVSGKVQNCSFRQTIVRGALSRGLVAGATNVENDSSRVDISISGDSLKVKEMIDEIKSGKELNSRGAQCTKIVFLENGRQPLEHEINTSNVNDLKSVRDTIFYI